MVAFYQFTMISISDVIFSYYLPNIYFTLYSQIQRMVISGGNFKPDTLKPKEVVSLLLDDEEIELKCK